jgi:hypothetical protein
MRLDSDRQHFVDILTSRTAFNDDGGPGTMLKADLVHILNNTLPR